MVGILLHRLITHNQKFGRFVEGQKIELYGDSRLIDDHLKRALICKEDLMQGVRKSALTVNMDQIDKVYIERNGDKRDP